ncbi:ABC transporter G member 36, partial [Turnera subulata]
LPTYDRLRKGSWISPSKHATAEIDVGSIELEARKDLLNRLVKVAQDDNEQFLLKLRNHFDAVGIRLPTIEVRLEHVKVEAETDVASRALPSLYNFSAVATEGQETSVVTDYVLKHLRRQGPVFLMSLRRVLEGAFSYHAKLFIEEVMEVVELDDLRQVLVGLPGLSGLSMEQRKRLTIAVELVANPSIIFMDEPTSGLDARAAAVVMRTVRNTVDTGRTVVCTIHQPSIDIFESFDEVIELYNSEKEIILFLLKKGGQEIYAGPLGHHSAHLIQYFEAIEGVNKIKEGQNPATWMLEVTSVATEIALGVDFAAVYRISELRNKAIIRQLSTPAPDAKDLYFPTRFSQSSFTQFKACLWKQRQSYWRNPPYTAVKFLFATTVALVFGSIYWDLGSKMENRQDLFNSLGSMYVPLLFVGIQNFDISTARSDCRKDRLLQGESSWNVFSLALCFRTDPH